MSYQHNNEFIIREAREADAVRDQREEVDVIYGYNKAVSNLEGVTQGLVEGKKFAEISRQVVGDYASEGERLGFKGDRDGTEWLIKTQNGELVVADVESIAHLTEDLRMLPSGYSVKNLVAVVRGKESNPEIYSNATTLFTPEEKVAIAANAVENLLLLKDERVSQAVSTFVNGQNEIFIVTPDDYHLFNIRYNPTRPETEYVYRGGHHISAHNYKFRQGNGRVYTTEAEIAKDNTQVVVVRESRFFNRRKVAGTISTEETTNNRAKNSARLETSRVLTHELVHSTGIGAHLGPMEEITVEFYAIRAQTLGEQKRGEETESLYMNYEAGVSFFTELYTALRDREGLGTKTLDEAFMWGEINEMQEVIDAIGHLLGKKDGGKLAKFDFKTGTEAYLWLRAKLSQ